MIFSFGIEFVLQLGILAPPGAEWLSKRLDRIPVPKALALEMVVALLALNEVAAYAAARRSFCRRNLLTLPVYFYHGVFSLHP
jgi:hypothetical protein